MEIPFLKGPYCEKLCFVTGMPANAPGRKNRPAYAFLDGLALSVLFYNIVVTLLQSLFFFNMGKASPVDFFYFFLFWLPLHQEDILSSF